MSHNPAVSRRKFFAVAAGLGAAALGAAESAPAVAGPGIPVPPAPVPLPDLPPVLDASPANFASPPLRRFVTELPRIPTRDAGGTLTAQTSVHRYHPDLPATPVLGYHDGILGPTLQARQGQPSTVVFGNEIGDHPLAGAVDLTMHGATDRDRRDPRTTVHLQALPPTRPRTGIR